MKFNTITTMTGWAPCDPESEEKHKKIKKGSICEHDIKVYRNPGFHRKMFALFNFAFAHWEPPEISTKYGTPKKNFKTFRNHLTVLAGYHEVTYKLDGSFKIEAQSLSYGNMEPEDFEKHYSAVIDVVLERVCVGQDKEQVEYLAMKTLEFT